MECCPWNSPAQNTGMGSLSFFQGIFPTQGSNPGLMNCRQILYQLNHRVTNSRTWLSGWTELNWTAKSLNKSILKEINPGYSLEGVRLKLKLQYPGHLRRRTEPLEKTLVLGKIEGKARMGDRGWGGWITSLTPNKHEFAQTLGDTEGQGILASCSPWDCKESNNTEGLNNNLSPLHLALLLVFCLFLFFFFWNILLCCLILPHLLFLFHVFGSLVTFPNLVEVPPCRRRFVCLRSRHQMLALGVTPMCAVWVFMCGGLTAVGALPSVPDLWPSWLPHPVLSGGWWLLLGHTGS